MVRNDAMTLEEMTALPLSHLVISPGPCTPDQSGISLEAIRHFAGRLPVLGYAGPSGHRQPTARRWCARAG